VALLDSRSRLCQIVAGSESSKGIIGAFLRRLGLCGIAPLLLDFGVDLLDPGLRRGA
jgi:hypothetical protein